MKSFSCEYVLTFTHHSARKLDQHPQLQFAPFFGRSGYFDVIQLFKPVTKYFTNQDFRAVL